MLVEYPPTSRLSVFWLRKLSDFLGGEELETKNNIHDNRDYHESRPRAKKKSRFGLFGLLSKASKLLTVLVEIGIERFAEKESDIR
jgi:hypothetical protein